AKSGLFNYISKGLMAIVDAATFFMLTKMLTVEDYGLYSLSLAVFSFFIVFVPMGLPGSLLRFIPEYIERKRKDLALIAIRWSFCITILAGILLFLACFIFDDKIGHILKNDRIISIFGILVLIGILNVFIRLAESVLDALFLQVYRNICQILAGLTQFILFTIIFYKGLGIKILFIAIAISVFMQSVLYISKIFLYFSSVKIDNKRDNGETKRFFIFGTKEYFFRILGFFWEIAFDIYIISYLLGPVSVGIFGFAASISYFIYNWSPGIVLNSVLSPLFVRQHTAKNPSLSVGYLFKFYNKFKAFFIFPVLAGVWILADKFIFIVYDNLYISSVFPLKILLLFMTFQAFARPIKNVFDALEKNELALYGNFLIPYRILASFFLIKRFGINGAVFAYGSSIFLFFLLELFFLKRVIKVEYPLRSFLKIFVNTFIMGIVLLGLRYYIGSNLYLFISTVITGIAAYLFLSYINKPFEEKERDIINNGIGMNIWRF
ncbi:MAG: oligosaccharide flippase family protein, partial [Candidatus Omnitrophica bacterium]|nr:oligosaccharide flippase family protein [Candidatus Omnitrophota bacterium]